MDNTEIYIKMSEKAVELQTLSPNNAISSPIIRPTFEQGNWYAVGNSVYVESYDSIYAGHIWLPRQDQLQEMCWDLTETKWTPFFALTMIRDFAQDNSYHSMEQLWLAFLYKEKYNKVWDSNKEDWLTIS